MISKYSTIIASFLEKYFPPLVGTLFRIYLAFIFWNLGSNKVSDWYSSIVFFNYGRDISFFWLSSLMSMLVFIDFLFSLFIFIGLFSRFTVCILVFAYLIEFIFFRSIDLGLCLVFSYLFIYGPGSFSCDTLLKKYTENSAQSDNEEIEYSISSDE